MVKEWQWVVRGQESQQKELAGVLGGLKDTFPEVVKQAYGKEA
jgi:hypothetical protein